MHKLSYGLYIVTTKDGEKANGCIVNTAIQAASTPNQLCICINKANYTHDMVLKTGVFNVSVLSKTAQFLLYQRFGFQSGREVDKFADYTAYQNAENGVPYITEGTNAYLAVKVTQTVDLGSHTMFIGEVTEMEVLSEEPSANYEYYQEEVKPKPEEVGKPQTARRYGAAPSAVTNTWARNCRKILSVRCANTQLPILKGDQKLIQWF